jgi:trehalose 6-phosphate phosphatase
LVPVSRRPAPTSLAPPLLTADDALLLDVDGTLLDIAPTPAAVTVPPAVPNLLSAVAHALGGALALVSGRAIADVDHLFAPLHLSLVGQHGLEWRWADGPIEHADAAPIPGMLGDEVAAFAAANPGLLLEQKGGALALHFRARPDLAAAAGSLLRSCADRWEGLEVLAGKMVAELRPAGVTKGTGIRRLRTRPPFAGRDPVFVGDDVTDEDGFDTVTTLGGHGVLVGPDRATGARYRLPTVAAVHAWLRDSLATLTPPGERV